MKIIFIDETDQQTSPTVHAFFCICGLVIDDAELIPTANELEKIKVRHSLTNLKKARKSGLDEAKKITITTEIFECLSRHHVEIIAIVLGDFSMSYKLPKDDMYMGAISFLMERFTLTLKKAATSGLTVFDCLEKTLEKSLREKFYKYIRTNTVRMAWEVKPKAAMRDYVHPTLLFIDDEQSILTQTIDLIAVSLNSAIVNTTRKDPKIIIENLRAGNKFLNIYWPLFAKSPKGNVKGWGIKVWD